MIALGIFATDALAAVGLALKGAEETGFLAATGAALAAAAAAGC